MLGVLITSVLAWISRGLNFGYNLIFVFSLQCRVGHSELIGVCEVGPNSLGQGKDHWEEMLGSPRKQIAHWYQLQESTPSLSAASISSTMKGCMTPQQSVE